MACAILKALPRLAILDPGLTATQPAKVAAATGIDAIGSRGGNGRLHETKRDFREICPNNPGSFSNRLTKRPSSNPQDDEARAKMLLGAHLAGCAIENSMLGAAHATANPLTSEFNITHGLAVGLMLPHVIRFNSNGKNPYSDLESQRRCSRAANH